MQYPLNKCAFTFSSKIRQIQYTRTEFWCVRWPSVLDKHQIQASALDLSYFMSKSKCKFINLIHTWQKNKIICSCSWKFLKKKMALKCHLTWRILTTLPSEKNGSVDVMFMPVITHQKYLAQSGRSTWSAVNIFSTLRVFTHEPIREQEIKLECMNTSEGTAGTVTGAKLFNLINWTTFTGPIKW